MLNAKFFEYATKADAISQQYPRVTKAAKGMCCAAGVCGLACCPCTPCVAGAVGCSAVSTACADCIKKQKLELQNKSPNYDPPGKSIVMDRSNNGENNGRIDTQYIIDYIKKGITYSINDDDIISNFRNIVPLDNYNETYAAFLNSDKSLIDSKIRRLNASYKKNVGGKKSKKYSNQKNTRKRRKTFLKNKKKRKTNKHNKNIYI
jgi:hypothetical protein